MAKIHDNGGMIGKTLDFNATDSYTTGSSNKKNSGIWNIGAAVKSDVVTGYSGFTGTSTISEGQDYSFSYPVTGVADGTTVDITASGTNITTSDFTSLGGWDSSLTQTVTISGGNVAFSFNASADAFTEGDETLTFTLAATDSAGNATESRSITLTVEDTSKTVSYGLSSAPGYTNPSQMRMDEGTYAYFYFYTANRTEVNPVTMYWSLNNAANDFPATSGTCEFVTQLNDYPNTGDTANIYRLQLGAYPDSTTEGTEYFTLSFREFPDSTPGAIVAATVIVNDTSTSVTYGLSSISDSTPDEGTTPRVTFYATSYGGAMYWSIDSGTSDFNLGSGSFSPSSTFYDGSTGITTYYYAVDLSVTADQTTEGNETHLVRFRTGSTSGTIVATAVLNVQDTSTTPPPVSGPDFITASNAAPILGSGGASPWPPVGYTSIVNSSTDDGNSNIQITGLFTDAFYFNGSTYPTSMYIGSNGYLTFGSGYNTYSGISASTPPAPKIHFGAADNSYQRVAYYRNSTVGTVRYEGNGSTSGTVGNPGIAVEITFYAPNSLGGTHNQVIEIRTGLHNRVTGQWGLFSATSSISSNNGTLSANSSYVWISDDSTGTSWTGYPNHHVNVEFTIEPEEPPANDSSSFTQIASRQIDSDLFMGSTADYSGPYDVHVTDPVTWTGTTGRVYLAAKVTSTTTYYSDIPIACVQHFNSAGTLQNSWNFSSSTGGTGSGWTTTTAGVTQPDPGMTTTPAVASTYPYVSIAAGATSNKFNWATSTGSSYTGAAGGIGTTYDNNPITTSVSTNGAISQVDTSYFMYLETSGSTHNQAHFARSPLVTINDGDYFKIAYAVTGYSTNPQNPNDCLWFGVY